MTDPWEYQAACKDMPTDDFFPDKGNETQAARAKQVCATCPVKDMCRDLAVNEPIVHGIFGGYSVRERRVLRKAA